jgi:hypothetical protein
MVTAKSFETFIQRLGEAAWEVLRCDCEVAVRVGRNLWQAFGGRTGSKTIFIHKATQEQLWPRTKTTTVEAKPKELPGKTRAVYESHKKDAFPY